MKRNVKIIFLLLCAVIHVNSYCLLSDTSVGHRCLIQERLADTEELNSICSDYDPNHKLTIIAVFHNKLMSHRDLQTFCNEGHIGRMNWIKYSVISEYLLNSKDVDMVSCRILHTLIKKNYFNPKTLIISTHVTINKS